LLVRAGRLELPRPLGQQILSLPRLPFRHARIVANYSPAGPPVNGGAVGKWTSGLGGPILELGRQHFG
jgi:hypothetical protein